MPAVALILILLAATAALDLAARRLQVPHPVLLVLGGLVLALTPGLPRPQLDPDIIFLIFVPPLLYRTALTTSWRDFRANLRSILLLAVGLVIVTIVVIAVVAHKIVPGFSWSAAFLLGAIVSPPDPIAATAVSRHLDVPRDIETILEGEGLVNDATALVAYKMGVDAATSGAFALGAAAERFVVAAAGGIAIGIGVALIVTWLRRRLDTVPEVESTISLLTPFAAFIPAERLGVSGVLAVVAVGLYLGREAPRLISPETRLQASSMWDMTTFLLEGLIFILIGLDLPIVTRELAGSSLLEFAGYGVVISAAAILVRLAWMFPGAYLPRRLDQWRGHDPDYPPWRHVLFVGWAGMRGADSLVIALALPLSTAAGMPFPGRGAIIIVTFIVILITLVAQGLTLEPLIRRLALSGDESADEEETVARLRTAKAGIAKLDELIAHQPHLAASARDLRADHIHRIHRYEGRRRNRRHLRDEAYADGLREARKAMIAAERGELVRLRDDSVIGDDVLRRVQHDLDLEQMLVGGSDERLSETVET